MHIPPERRGFTLIEMICVVFLLLLLLGIFGTIGMETFHKRPKEFLARAEITRLAHLLEDYRSAYGDYPWIAQHNAHQGNILFAALLGKILPDGTPQTGTDFIDSPLNEVNPFGQEYIYYYRLRKQPERWENASYILISPRKSITPDISSKGFLEKVPEGALIITNSGFIQ